VTGRSANEGAARARLNRVLNAIERTSSPIHFLDVTVHGAPSEEMSVKKVTLALRAWIAGLPGDEEAFDAPPFEYEEHGARIALRAWPRRVHDNLARAIGARFYSARTVTIDNDLRSALKGKASRYGVLDHPYVVAVNALDRWADAAAPLGRATGFTGYSDSPIGGRRHRATRGAIRGWGLAGT
jgi:hypothetical protein